ncbi:MAG: adenylosuccinate synthetase [Bacteroides sp.]|jgi:adenylosuccinate synthase|nr:adenylosuccinate synthetase [Bacteroides sp.]MCI1681114.1 adenylosuccinate synthetase [Bacteroides sp.]
MVRKKVFVVVGLGYGDEGKGLSTDYLCKKNPDSIVIRYNGGHQAGHSVVMRDGRRHVFSNFGSGTYRNIPTYWSSFCTFYPSSFLEELSLLNTTPIMYVDLNCPVTTHYDVLFNRALEASRGEKRYGSCGIGYGATIDRSKNSDLLLRFEDLLNERKTYNKLLKIKTYYRQKINIETFYDFDSFINEEEDNLYFNSIKETIRKISDGIIRPICEENIFSQKSWETYIFEGAQGILLDQNYGNKPYITKSNTTSQNALCLLDRYNNILFEKSIYYVTRSYLTRHGEGPFKEDRYNFKLYNNTDETNIDNQYQGKFKTNYLELKLLNYALKTDAIFSKGIEKNLIITCLDHLESQYIYFFNNALLSKDRYTDFYKRLICHFKEIKYSFNPCADFL